MVYNNLYYYYLPRENEQDKNGQHKAEQAQKKRPRLAMRL